MIRPTTPSLSLIFAALVALGAAGCDIWPSSNDTARKDAAKDLKPSQAAAAPQAPVAQPPALAALPPSPPPRMTNAEEADFDSWIVKTYLGCWRPPAQPADSDPYVAHVRLAFKPDGSLARAPKLVNPPSDPALKPQAKSVMQAVQACNPLPVPAQYRPFYEQWKTKTIHFNPQVAAR
jgi:hypothetical protein